MKNNGVLAALGAYILWGLLPVFWKLLQTVPSIEILFHRMVWSLVFLVIIITVRNQWKNILPISYDRKVLLSFVGSAILLSGNWFTYIYAVNSAHIVEASLGYFINPLLSVLLGVFLLKERPSRMQWIAIGIAGIGVAYLTYYYGQLPWISLVLAITFALYGLLRKISSLGSINGLFMEMVILFLPAMGILLYFNANGTGHFGHAGIQINVLLGLTGVATAIPLLLFAYGAQRVELSTVGVMQYLAPTLQFLVGIFIYNEQFDLPRLIGFSIVWIALIIYSLDRFILQKHRKLNELLFPQ